MQTAFDDDGKPVGVVSFDYDKIDDPDEAGDVAAIRREVIVRTLQFLTGQRATAKRAGQRAILLAHLVRVGDCKTQRELARRLGLSPAAISKKVNALRKDLSMLTADC
jgi:hypothetical protein